MSAPDPRSLLELIASLVHDIPELLEKEVRLARSEAARALDLLLVAIRRFALGSVVAVGAVGVALAALVNAVTAALIAAGMQARRIDENDLRLLAAADAENAMARRLRLGTDDAHLAIEQCVQQRRLAHVGPADDRDETAPELRTDFTGGFGINDFVVAHRYQESLVSDAPISGLPVWTAGAATGDRADAVGNAFSTSFAAACSARRRLGPMPTALSPSASTEHNT